MQVANKCNISICNVGSDKFIEDLKTFLGSTGGKTDDVETAPVKEEPKVEEAPVAETPKESVTVNVEDLEDIW